MDLLEKVCVEAGAVFSYVTDDLAEGRMLLQARRAVLTSLEVLGTWLTDDVSVPRTEMAALIAACERISREVGLTIGVVGHAGDGNMHPTIVFDNADPEQRAAAKVAFGRILDAGRALGGTVTGEHGIGRVKQDFLAGEIGPVGLAGAPGDQAGARPGRVVQSGVDVRRPTAEPAGRCGNSEHQRDEPGADPDQQTDDRGQQDQLAGGQSASRRRCPPSPAAGAGSSAAGHHAQRLREHLLGAGVIGPAAVGGWSGRADPSRVRRPHDVAEFRHRPAGGGLDGALGQPGGLGDLGLGQTAVVPQHQHFSLPGCQVAERGDHRLMLGGQHRQRLGGPRGARVRRNVRPRGPPAAQHRPRPVDHGRAQVADRGVPVPQPAPVPVEPGERLLHDVLGAGHVVHQQDRQPDHLHAVGPVDVVDGDRRRAAVARHGPARRPD